MSRLGLLALLGLASGSLLTAVTKAGDRAPEIHFDKLLPEQPAANAGFNALAGKVVVLEMWATWCGPCVGAIPHINELAEKFKDRPIVFLSATDEEPAVVEAFLKKRPISGLVGIAHTDSPSRLYGVDTIPVTFLIDATGKVAGSIDPDMLNAPMLEDLMAGRPLSPLDLSVRPLLTGNSLLIRSGWNSIVTKDAKLQYIISLLWGVRQSRMTGMPLDERIVYDITLSIPGATPATFRPWAGEIIAAALHIKVVHETRETDVWILSKPDAKPAALVEPAHVAISPLIWFPATPPSSGGSMKLAYVSVSDIAMFMETAAGKPVLDETGITGRYDFNMPYERDDPLGRLEGMRKAGFKVEPARRMIDFLTVTRTE